MKVGAFRLVLILALTLVLCSRFGAQSVFAQSKSGPPERQPVSLTTILEKQNTTDSLEDWFAKFSESEETSPPQQTFAAGYNALTFSMLLDGSLQRVVALDLGDGRVLLHATTKRRATEQDLLNSVQPFITEAFKLSVQAAATEPIECNCVRWARTQVSSIPRIDLTSYSAKLSIINHLFPRVGSAAIHPAPAPYTANGHMSVIRNVQVNSDGSLTVTIQEANWKHCQITWRTGTPEALNIKGYFDPAYPYGGTPPRIDSLSPASGAAGRQFYMTANGVGFDPNSVQAIIMGGWCDTFAKCVIPTNVIVNRSSTSLQIPLTMNSRGRYTIYLFNSSSGKSSNGKPVTIY